MSQKLTARDLLGSLIDLEQEKEYAEMLEDSNEKEIEIASIEQSIDTIKKQISNKIEGIDYFMVEMKREVGLVDAEIKSYNDEIKRLRLKKAAVKKTEDYFNKVLLPMIIETAGEDGVFRTKTSKYKMYETWGALEIIDEDAIPDQYKRYKVEVDKKGARKDVIESTESGLGISGFKIEKTKRIRRS